MIGVMLARLAGMIGGVAAVGGKGHDAPPFHAHWTMVLGGLAMMLGSMLVMLGRGIVMLDDLVLAMVTSVWARCRRLGRRAPTQGGACCMRATDP